MQYITETDLKQWANNRNSQGELPKILRQLIGIRNTEYLEIPGDDNIYKPGPDGRVKTKVDTILGEPGEYIIEISQKKRIREKIKSDFNERKNKQEYMGKIFAFITTRAINNKSDFVKQLRDDNNFWKDIKIFDVDDVVIWLENDFAATCNLAEIMGIPLEGLQSIKGYWDEWCSSCNLSYLASSTNEEGLILGRYNKIDSDILEFINSESGILKIQGPNFKDALLVFIAFLRSKFKKNELEAILIKNKICWDKINTYNLNKTTTILIPMFCIPDNLDHLKKQGYKIFIPIGRDNISENERLIKLEFNLNSLLIDKLKYHNIESSRHFTLTHVQRVLSNNNSPAPEWAKKEKWNLWILLFLIGSWNEKNENDKEIMECLFGMPYSEIIKFFTIYRNVEYAPIRQQDGVWSAYIPEINIKYFSRYITDTFIQQYLEKTMDKVLFSSDERGKIYSPSLISGICQGYAIIRNTDTISLYMKSCIDDGIKRLLESNSSIWNVLDEYNDQNVAMLAEAAPEEFLIVLENVIENKSDILFEIYNRGFLSNVLYAIEKLVWFPIYFKRIVYVLIGLIKLLENDTEILHVLSNIFYPCVITNIRLEDKNKILNELIEKFHDKERNILFNLLYEIWTKRYGIGLRAPVIKKRDFSKKINISQNDFSDFRLFIFEKLLQLLHDNKEQYIKIISHIIEMLPNEVEVFYNFISNLKYKHIDSSIKCQIYRGLYNYLSEGQNFLPQKNCKKLKDIFHDNKKCIVKIVKHELKDLKKIFNESGVKGMIKLLENIKLDDTKNFAAEIQDLVIQITPNDMKSILNIGIDNDAKNIHLFLSIFFPTIVHEKGTSILDIIFDNFWNAEYKKILLCSIETNKNNYWNWINRKELSKIYWENITGIKVTNDSEYRVAIEKLKEFNNYNAILELISQQYYQNKMNIVQSNDILMVIDNIEIKTCFDDKKLKISPLFNSLYQRKDVDKKKLSDLEEKFLGLIFLGSGGLKPIEIYNNLKHHPDFFVEIIRDHSPSKLYSYLNRMFFFNDDKELEIWISKIQNICEEIGDENLTKCVFLTLGKILANAPVDPKDNVWPIQYVRNTIENLNKNYFGFVKQGILINSINTVAPQELSKFWKQELEINTDFLLAFPNTATILKELSDHLIYLSQLPS